MIRYGAIALIALLIGLYVFSRSLNYIHGPSIDIYQPINGASISSSTVTIIGRANRINSLSLNGKSIFIDESGNFKETIIVFSGLNVITLDATDRFARSTQSRLRLTGTLPPEKR
jgi:Glucodextranase, domain B